MKLFQNKFVLKSIILLFSASSMASGWSPEVLQHAKSFSMPFKNGHVATLQGSCLAPKYKNKQLPGVRKDIKVRIPEFANREIKLKAVLQKDKAGNLIKAPVVFYIPGAFSNVDIQQTRRFRHDLGELGYHVVSFPNPWGTDFVKARPNKAIGDTNYEGQAMFALILGARDFLAKRNILGDYSRLVGVSYGGFVSTVVSALNVEAKDPMQLKDTTIISPPLTFEKTLQNLDTLVLRNKKYIKMNLISLLSKFKKVCKLKNDEFASPKIIRSAEGLVIRGGFFDDLITSVTKYNKIFSLAKVPGYFFGLLSRRYRKWKHNFTFETYFKEFAPENLKIIRSELGNLYYWKNRAKEGGYNKFRIVLAQNDFLNNKEDIRHTKDTIVLPTGGHYGFRYLPWFKELLNLSFTQK